MTSFLKRRLPVIAVLAVLLTGGAVAAMAAAGGAGHAGAGRHANSHLRGQRVLQAAASYIGVPLETLRQDLRSGKSLAQIATEAGKSEAGLVQALATAARAGLEQRLALAIKQPGGLRGERRFGHGLRGAAALYLGASPLELNAELRAGRTLGQIADATPGHSRSGLIEYLLAERKRTGNPFVARANATGAAHAARLRQRITAFVERPRAARAGTPKPPGSPARG